MFEFGTVARWLDAGALGDLLPRRGKRSRNVVVPELRGMPVPEVWMVAMHAGVHVRCCAVTEVRPVPGWVVAQEPSRGTVVPRDSVVTLGVDFLDHRPGSTAGAPGVRGPFG